MCEIITLLILFLFILFRHTGIDNLLLRNIKLTKNKLNKKHILTKMCFFCFCSKESINDLNKESILTGKSKGSYTVNQLT